MEKFKAYAKTLMVAIVGGYIFQILFVGTGMIFGQFFEPSFFIPNYAIILIGGGWIFWFAALRFKPFSKETWLKITVRGMALLVPWVIVVMGASILIGFHLWKEIGFWILSTVVSFLITAGLWKYLTSITEKE